MTEVQILKRKISGFRTSLTNKMKSAMLLARQAEGPPVNRAPIILSQLKAQLTEVTTTYHTLVQVLDDILASVVEDDDDSAFKHYMEVSAEFND